MADEYLHLDVDLISVNGLKIKKAVSFAKKDTRIEEGRAVGPASFVSRVRYLCPSLLLFSIYLFMPFLDVVI